HGERCWWQLHAAADKGIVELVGVVPQGAAYQIAIENAHTQADNLPGKSTERSAAKVHRNAAVAHEDNHDEGDGKDQKEKGICVGRVNAQQSRRKFANARLVSLLEKTEHGDGKHQDDRVAQ